MNKKIEAGLLCVWCFDTPVMIRGSARACEAWPGNPAGASFRLDKSGNCARVAYGKKVIVNHCRIACAPVFILCMSTYLVVTLVDRLVIKAISQETGPVKKQSVISKLNASMTDDRRGT